MIILTNAVFERTDEGCIKVAKNLIKRIKNKQPDTCVVSYENFSSLADHHFRLNKLLLDKDFIRFIRNRNDSVLYIPFPAKTIATALRIFILSRIVRKPLRVILVLKNAMNCLARFFLRISGAEIIVLSKDAENFYKQFLPADRVKYLKTGVDTSKFTPVTAERTKQLRSKYGLAHDRPVILHVGHLKYSRGLDCLMKIDPAYQVLLVVSTLTTDERDEDLRNELQKYPNIQIIDDYIPNIEEIYQLSDVYLFPVTKIGNCIDVPLSCMEAAACDKPVVTTSYGEMAQFAGKPGFYFINDNEASNLNLLIGQALKCPSNETRSAVLEYDWERAAAHFLNI